MSAPGRSGLARGGLARTGLVAGVVLQPALWAAGRWGVLGPDGGWVRALDRRGLEWMAARRAPALDALFESATHLGSFALTGPLVVALAIALVVRGRRASAAFSIAAFGGAALLAQIGKALVARPRPDAGAAVVAMPSDLSFPSAHATHAMAAVLVLAWLARERSRGARAAIALVGGAAVTLVALSRVYLQVHHPSDVVAGLLGAAAWVGGLWLAVGPGRT